MDDPIKAALEKFDVPTEHEEFLFIFPLLYVAKADGTIGLKESYEVMMSAISTVTPPKDNKEEKVLQDFLEEQVTVFKTKKNLPDSRILTDAISALMSKQSTDEAQAIRKTMYDACVKVAQTSGPMFKEKVSDEERKMLESFFGTIL